MENQQLSSINVLGEGFVIDGVRVTIPTQCVVSGTILQHIECHGKLVLNRSAVIRGNIKAAELVIKGNYEGAVWARGTVVLSSTARFRGSISAARIVIEEGAHCQLVLNIDSDASNRYDDAELEEELHFFRGLNGKSRTGTADKRSDSSSGKSKATSGKLTDEFEMDRKDSPGKVADHFW